MPTSLNSKRFRISYRGFTLIELLVAISIVAIMATIALISYTRIQQNARDAKRAEDVDAIAKAIQVYAQNDNGLAPATTAGYADARLRTPLVPTFLAAWRDDVLCTTAGQSPCYYYGYDAATGKFAIFAKFEVTPTNGLIECPAITPPAGGGYNYCKSP